jgi:hypothetical protein
MAYSNVALKDKILEMYPEISQHGMTMGLDFHNDKNAYVITLKKQSHEVSAYLDKIDADECMDGVKCVHLGVKIGEFIKNYSA